MNLDHPEFRSLVPFLGKSDTRAMRTIPLKFSAMEVAKIHFDVGLGEAPRVVLPRYDCYLVMLYLEDAIHCDVHEDGSLAPPRFCSQGSICLIDLQGGAAVALQNTLSSIAIMLPKSLVAEVADLSASGLRSLRCRRAEPDPVIANLGTVLLSLFDRQSDGADAILRHIGVALCSHLLQDSLAAPAVDKEPVLSLAREAAAKNYIRANLSSELTVADIAAVTGLSPNHFSQAFKKVTGRTPHQWLMEARVESAKRYLSEHRLSLKEVANICGFVDQSHFTKVFSRTVGVTPAVWKAKLVN